MCVCHNGRRSECRCYASVGKKLADKAREVNWESSLFNSSLRIYSRNCVNLQDKSAFGYTCCDILSIELQNTTAGVANSSDTNNTVILDGKSSCSNLEREEMILNVTVFVVRVWGGQYREELILKVTVFL